RLLALRSAAHSQQPFALITLQLFVGDGPRGVSAPAAVTLLRLDPTGSAPLAASELYTPDDPGEFIDGIPLPHLLPLDQYDEHGFDFFKAFFQCHGRTLLFLAV
ncbi:MAG: hypothetical protein Q8K78_10680, partial [Planctomycetaceae bacterium]|nr:hypothetical protein [Planctomycetaceae bacterium]